MPIDLTADEVTEIIITATNLTADEVKEQYLDADGKPVENWKDNYKATVVGARTTAAAAAAEEAKKAALEGVVPHDIYLRDNLAKQYGVVPDEGEKSKTLMPKIFAAAAAKETEKLKAEIETLKAGGAKLSELQEHKDALKKIEALEKQTDLAKNPDYQAKLVELGKATELNESFDTRLEAAVKERMTTYAAEQKALAAAAKALSDTNSDLKSQLVKGAKAQTPEDATIVSNLADIVIEKGMVLDGVKLIAKKTKGTNDYYFTKPDGTLYMDGAKAVPVLPFLKTQIQGLGVKFLKELPKDSTVDKTEKKTAEQVLATKTQDLDLFKSEQSTIAQDETKTKEDRYNLLYTTWSGMKKLEGSEDKAAKMSYIHSLMKQLS